MAVLVPRNNLRVNPNLPRIDHGLDLDDLRLPFLPPGPYISSDGMSDGEVEILDEAPMNMRRKTIIIDMVDTDDEEAGGPANNRNEDQAEDEDDEDDEDDDDEEPVIIIPSRRGQKRKAETPNPKLRPPGGFGPHRANNATLGSAALGDTGRRSAKKSRAKNGKSVIDMGSSPGPSRGARILAPAAAEPAMMVAFGDEPAQEVPLGWGGLGIPDRGPPVAGPSNASAPAAINRSLPPAAPAAAGSSSDPHRLVRPTQKSPPIPSPRHSPEAEAPIPPVAPVVSVPARILTASDHLPSVLEFLPDICTAWAYEQIQAEMTLGQGDPATRVIQKAFDMEDGYPLAKATLAASTSTVAKKEEPNYRLPDYRRDERLGDMYTDSTHSLINELFPMIPVLHLRTTFGRNNKQLVPTYFALIADSQADPKPYVPLKAGRNPKGKGRTLLHAPFFQDLEGVADDDPFLVQRTKDGRAMYDLERKWLVEYLKKEAEESDAQKARDIAHAEALANGGGMECGCCYGEELMENMFQCNEGHLFCRECTKMHIDTKLGEQKHIIDCMDGSSCPAPFPESEIIRILPEKSLLLYHRLKQASELDSANIEGLETCPNCPFSAIIDNPDEKLFRCMAPACGAVTCRKCKKEQHLPKTCEEMEADRKLDKRHAVEDAMSDALIRRCPKCDKPFFKDEGCNKITCHLCGTASCYICRKIITNGYAHFDQNPADYTATAAQGKCALWDKQGNQDANAIVAARDAAQVAARLAAADEGIQLADADLNVEAPVAPRPAHLNPYAHQALRYVPAAPARQPEAMAQALADAEAMVARLAAIRGQMPHAPNPLIDHAQHQRDVAEQQRLVAALYAGGPGGPAAMGMHYQQHMAALAAMAPAPPPRPIVGANARMNPYRPVPAVVPAAIPPPIVDPVAQLRAQQAARQAEMERVRALALLRAARGAGAARPAPVRVPPDFKPKARKRGG